MAQSPLRLTFVPHAGKERSAILGGLDPSASAVVPDWVKQRIPVETWIGRGLSVDAMRETVIAMPHELLHRGRSDADAILWTSRDDTILEIDLTLPLLLLARDLADLGQLGDLALGGA